MNPVLKVAAFSHWLLGPPARSPNSRRSRRSRPSLKRPRACTSNPGSRVSLQTPTKMTSYRAELPFSTKRREL